MYDLAEFQGGVFSDAVDGGRAGAEIELRHDGIVARTSDGGEFVVSYSECQLEIGGASGRMVFCRNPDRTLTIFCEDRRFPAALERESAGVLMQELDEIRRGRSHKRSRARVLFFAGAAVLIGLAIGGYYAILAGARAGVRTLPMSVDKKIGKAVIESMELGGPRVEDPVVVDAIDVMIDRLAPHAAVQALEFTAHVVDAPMVNAFALPGGQIIVYTGLIAKAEEPEQVAGVLAHEMAHVTLRHGLQRIAQAAGVVVVMNLLLGDAGGLVAIGGEVLTTTTINSYSRDQESEADAQAVRTLHAAGIDPRAMAEFFEAMNRERDALPGIASWFSTHPDHQQRIREIRQQLADMPQRDYDPLVLEWNEVLRRVRRMKADDTDGEAVPPNGKKARDE